MDDFPVSPDDAALLPRQSPTWVVLVGEKIPMTGLPTGISGAEAALIAEVLLKGTPRQQRFLRSSVVKRHRDVKWCLYRLLARDRQLRAWFMAQGGHGYVPVPCGGDPEAIWPEFIERGSDDSWYFQTFGHGALREWCRTHDWHATAWGALIRELAAQLPAAQSESVLDEAQLSASASVRRSWVACCREWMGL